MNNPDVVAEFRVVTNQFLPEYGRAAGSVVNVLTKSGTNAFHGSAFWMYNGNSLNARSNLDKRTFTKAPWRVQNQGGGTVGGPVIKDKTFFFASGLRWTDHRFASGTAIGGAPTTEGQTVIRNAVGTLPQVKALLENLPAAQAPTGERGAIQLPRCLVRGSGRHIVWSGLEHVGRLAMVRARGSPLQRQAHPDGPIHV